MYQRDDVVQVEMLKPKIQRGARGWGGITFAPEWTIEQETHFRFIEFGQELQARPADDLFLPIRENAPVAIAIFLPMRLLPSNKALDFLQWRWRGVGKVTQNAF